MAKFFDVICIGAALVDMVAKVDREPLDDDEVFVPELHLFSGGAAANTAYACAKLGLKVAFIGKLGYKDQFKDKIINEFKEVSLDTSLIRYSKDHGTGLAYVALKPNGERRIYAYSGAANTLTPNDIKSEDIIRTKTIFLSSLKNLEPFKRAAEVAKKNNIPVILNPGMLIIAHGFNNIKDLLVNIDILILSKREFRLLLHLGDVELSKQVIEEKSKNIFKLGIKIIIITMGKEGAMVLNSEKSELVKPIEVAEVVDTTGAGDAFSAGFIYGFIRNLSFKFKELKSNVIFGNIIAGNCIQKLGARNGILTTDELEQKSFNN